MIITWLGHSAFKIESKDVTLVTDPYDPKVGFKFPKVTADIVTISHDHFDHANADGVAGEPLIIDSQGEYEIKEVFVMGIPSFHDKKEGADRGSNIIYRIEIENITLAHLGDLGHILTDQQLEKLQGIDILMIPVGGNYTIDFKDALEVINQLEPRVVIPMHYALPGLKVDIDTVDKFCKEMGCSPTETQDKYKVTKKDLPTDETQVILLSQNKS